MPNIGNPCFKTSFPVLSIIIFLFVLLLPAPAENDDSTAILLDAGRQAKTGNYSAALVGCEKVLAGDPDQVTQGRAMFLAGYCHFKIGGHEKAREEFKKASQLYPLLSYHGLYYGAASYQEQKDYDNAVLLFEKLISHHPPGNLKQEASIELMRSFRRNDQPEETKEALARVRALAGRDNSWDRELEYTHAWIKTRQEAWSEARDLLVKLWRDHPESFWADQAESLINDNKQQFLLPGEESPFTDADRLQRIHNLLDKSRASKALAEIEPIIKNAEAGSPPSRMAALYKLRGLVHMEQRSFDSAIADFARSRGLSQDEDLELDYLTARCYQRSGRHGQAIDIYRKLWTEKPQCQYATRALYYAARLMKLGNDFQGAEKAYLRLVSDYPHSTLRAEATFQIAWIRYLEKDYKKAAMYLEQVPRKSRDDDFNARTLYWKSVAYRLTGEDAKATEAENQVLAHYWKTAYSFYLVYGEGRSWPYHYEKRVVPIQSGEPPIEYHIARELLALGLEKDAEGQLKYLDDNKGIDEWLAWAMIDMYMGLGDYYGAQRMAYRKLGHRLKSAPPNELEAWQAAFPQAFPELVNKYAAQYNLDPHLVWSLMRAESTYRPSIKSWAGAVGLMQIMPATGKQIARELKEPGYSTAWLDDPEVNVRYGCYYLSGRLKQFSTEGADPAAWLGTVSRALGAYNAGPGRIADWGQRADQLGLTPPAFVEEIPITETRDYVKRILGFYLVYHYTYPKQAPPAAKSQ